MKQQLSECTRPDATILGIKQAGHLQPLESGIHLGAAKVERLRKVDDAPALSHPQLQADGDNDVLWF